MLPPDIFPPILAWPPVAKLPPVMVLVALTIPLVKILLPVILPVVDMVFDPNDAKKLETLALE